jgi:hypothetical protein
MVASGLRGAGSVTELHIAGRAGVPSDAAAVAINLTVTETGGAGYAVAYPCDTAPPNASTVNFSGRNVTASNSAVTPLDADGNVCIAVVGAASQVVVDLFGYFPAGTRYQSNAPRRILDTRHAQSPAVASMVELDVVGAGVPAGAAAVVLNLTATETEGPGYVVASACGTTPPEASSLNYTAAAQTIPNLVVAPVDAQGRVCFWVSGAATHLVADLSGHLPAGTSFRPVGPARLADSRPTPVKAGETVEVQVAGRAGVGAAATTAIVNVTAVLASGSAFVTVHPCDQPRPNASSVNVATGGVQANTVFAQIDPAGKICAYVGGADTDLLVDIDGTFDGVDPGGVRVVDPAVFAR